MSVDRAKVLQAAQKHLAKGAYDKAIAEFRKLVQADPADIRTWLKIGDLQTRSGDRAGAIQTYARVADQYAEQGFFLKAVAVYKQILKLDPSRLDVQLKLAEQYEMLQLVSDALSTYEHVAAGYARAGNIDKALATLQKMTELDPENIPVRIKCAEALSKAGRTKEAAEEFEAGAGLLKQQGRIDDYIKVAERLLFHKTDDVETARELAALYLERDDPKRALSKLQLCFKADPKDIPTLELLAEAFNKLGQLPKTISVYKEVARIHHEANRQDERARILKRILELDPGDAEARKGLAGFASATSASRRDIVPPASAVVEPSTASAMLDEDEPEMMVGDDAPYSDEIADVDEVEMIDVDEEEDILIDEEVDIIESVPSGPRGQSVPPDVQKEAQIARLLTECDVFLRYGLKQKVIEQLSQVLQIAPDHVEARERLKDLYLEEGRIDDAIAQLLALADVLAEEHSAAAAIYLRQILDLDPSHEVAVSRLSGMGASLPPPAPEAVPGAPAEDDIFFVEDEPPEEPVTAEAPLEPELEPEAERTVMGSVPDGLLDDDADDFASSTAADAASYDEREEAEAPRRAMVPPPSTGVMVPPPSASVMVPPPSTRGVAVPPPSGAQLLDPLAPMTPDEFDHVPLRPSSPGQAHAEASQRLSLPPGEVEELLDEADFFIAQGLFDEARGTLNDSLRTFPNHPIIMEKLRDVEQLAAAGAAQRSSASLEMDLDQSFELAEKLAEEFDDIDETQTGSDILDVEQVFAQFKKGVEAQVGVEDTETHFDLGIAYKEMGLLDDAINEFRLCLVNTQRICIAETMIGICCIEKGEVAEAITHFKKGLYADSKSDREELGLYFELGHAYELLHDPKEAIYYYQKVQKRDPDFRNVDARILNLSQPQAAEEESPPAIAQDDIDRAFDDLMGED